MNRSNKNVFTVLIIVLMISLAMTTMSRACLAISCGTCRLTTSETILDEADPNDVPGDCPEMVPNIWINNISEDPNEPEPTPEMVPDSLWINVISEDSNDVPNPTPEMVPFI